MSSLHELKSVALSPLFVSRQSKRIKASMCTSVPLPSRNLLSLIFIISTIISLSL